MCSSYDNGSTEYACVGLAAPVLFNGGTLMIKDTLFYAPKEDEALGTEDNKVEIKESSTDGTTWKRMKKSIKLAPGQSLWLKLTGKSATSASKYICRESSFADYSAPWVGFTRFTLDFAGKRATAEYTYYDD